MTFSLNIPVLYIGTYIQTTKYTYATSISGDFNAGTEPELFYDLSSNIDCQ